ncbi:tRNA pseudouridine(55) synthase TruB [Agrilactobacillus fermenti]|uniref:tRNA pseudouridine(55) synthase TruB n=1 Tax=Agrilactobacillus fermenti TaxID=2586909 RepID=UPI001E3B7D96|nr:tRNA pseudouridine(55) synthase TruB [Agrilactobacillus fermenti]MCD2257381.1 tRNA pseudouridine(55) synthase TruB [Agrilactobacillus fermenti]
MDGILPLYKEAGMTSHDCVAAIRKIIHQKKVGHSGTLDPAVEGVLPICLGNTTKVVNYLMTKGKTYTGKIILGEASETEDLEGKLIAREPLSKPFEINRIKTAMQALTGDLIQIPPMYSAVKVHGMRLYEYARRGLPVERPERPVHIYRFDFKQTAFDENSGLQTIQFEAEVSKGTYIRTLAVDLGKQLGVPALMAQLTRQSSGGFTISQTIRLNEFAEAVSDGKIESYLFPLDHALSDYPKIEISTETWSRVKNGGFLELPGETEAVVALTYQEHIKALYQRKRDDIFKPLSMFLENEGIRP